MNSPSGEPLGVVVPIRSGITFTARRLASGDTAVLAPDGLTWVESFRDFEAAERYAERCNAWADAFPMPDELVPIHEHFQAPTEPPTPAELAADLLAICSRLCGPSDVRLREWR